MRHALFIFRRSSPYFCNHSSIITKDASCLHYQLLHLLHESRWWVLLDSLSSRGAAVESYSIDNLRPSNTIQKMNCTNLFWWFISSCMSGIKDNCCVPCNHPHRMGSNNGTQPKAWHFQDLNRPALCLVVDLLAEADTHYLPEISPSVSQKYSAKWYQNIQSLHYIFLGYWCWVW